MKLHCSRAYWKYTTKYIYIQNINHCLFMQKSIFCQTFAFKYRKSNLTKTLNSVVNISNFAEYINYTVKPKIKDPAIKNNNHQTTTKGLCAYLHTWLVNRSINQSAPSVVRSVYSGARQADALRLPMSPSVLCFILKQREQWGGRTTRDPIREDKLCPRSHDYHTALEFSVQFLSLWPTQSNSS